MRRTSIIGAGRGAAAPLSRLLAAGALALAAAAPRADEPSAPSSWLLGAQLTAVAQGHPAVPGAYSDPETSFGPGASLGWSLTASLMGGVVPWTGATIVAMPEYANGRGLPHASGLAGYPDGDLMRMRPGAMEPYLARLYLQQVFPLAGATAAEREETDPESRFLPGTPFALRRTRPTSRLEITAGKLAANDIFDLADAGSDPRHRFMNWALVNQAAWDFAADARGYTWGLVLALETPRWAVRGGLALVPTKAGGADLDWDVRHHRSEMVEGELRWRAFGGDGGAKLLLYVNRAHMGSYRDALAATRPGPPPGHSSPIARSAPSSTAPGCWSSRSWARRWASSATDGTTARPRPSPSRRATDPSRPPWSSAGAPGVVPVTAPGSVSPSAPSRPITPPTWQPGGRASSWATAPSARPGRRCWRPTTPSASAASWS